MDKTQVEELRRRVEILAAEVDKLRSGESETVSLSDQKRRSLGLAPSAAATYRRKTDGVSLAGYGEFLLDKYATRTQTGAAGGPAARLDLLRAVIYAGYRFNDKFLLNSEIEFEHGGEEVGVEFAYLDYLVNNRLTIRAGQVLMPLGLTNEFHEPTVFVGTHRPETERRILPSTWHENGAGVLGNVGLFNFRAYVVNGMNAEGFAAAGLRGGRQGGAEALTRNVAVTGRLDVTPVPGVFGGIGLYRGGSGQGQVQSGGDTLTITTTVTEFHGQAQVRGFDVRGLWASASVGDAGALSRALDLPTNGPVAEQMRGGYVQFGYNVLSQTKATVSALPFLRMERVNTQSRIPTTFTPALARDGRFTTIGLEIKPVPNIVLKADYQWISNEARTGRNQFGVNLGYAF